MPERDNTALSAAGTEFLRRLNVSDGARRDDPTSSRAEILRRGTRRVQHLQDLERDRARVPRWAAEQGNEIAGRWITRLHESAATVVGRLEDLQVDLDGLPEQMQTPEQIDVSDAVRFARELYEAAIRHYEKQQASTAPRSPDDMSVRELLGALRARLVQRAGRAGPS
jgi:hypothetical protein